MILEKLQLKKLFLLMALALLLVFVPWQTQAQNQRNNEMVALLEVFLTEIDLAIQQASFGAFAASLDEAHDQAQQVLNISVGENDDSFDTTAPNLGDGFGLIAYSRRLARLSENTDEFNAYRAAIGNITFFVQTSTELLKLALRSQNPNDARRNIRIAQGLLLSARGTPGDLPSEGGVRTLLALF